MARRFDSIAGHNRAPLLQPNINRPAASKECLAGIRFRSGSLQFWLIKIT
jgi:hypothetical protein